MALETVTTRLPQKTLEEIESIAKREKVDRSELIRRLLDAALRQKRIDEAVKAYGSGKVTLWKASEMAGISLREIMEIVRENKIPIPYTKDDLNRDLEHVKRRASRKQ